MIEHTHSRTPHTYTNIRTHMQREIEGDRYLINRERKKKRKRANKGNIIKKERKNPTRIN